MANVTLFYNKGRKTVFLSFSHNGGNSRRALSVRLEQNQWLDGKVVNHPDKKQLNVFLQSTLSQAQVALLELSKKTPIKSLQVSTIRDLVCDDIFNDHVSVLPTFQEVWVMKYSDCSEGSRRLADVAMRSILKYDKRKNTPIEEISLDWYNGYVNFLRENNLSTNSIIMYTSKIKSALSYAARKYNMQYPLTDVKYLRPESRPRTLSIDQLRHLFDIKAKWISKKYLDLFKLIFMLIGINMQDLCNLTNDSIRAGRLYYKRSKTGKEYDIKIEKEALEIINRYRGKDKLLSFFEGCDNVPKITSRIDTYISRLSTRNGLPPVTTYWMRHTWATIAFNDCDIPMDTIACALGHSSYHRVTAIYVHQDKKRVDEANRKVIDYVFGNNKGAI